ncbi:hypothetical protein [Nocardia sp. NPDC057455]|uniref:hypothetical protein n=1 Tax=Nocardia sp. NPDC057455 TaxID=3346138 RepID=UPI00366F8572
MASVTIRVSAPTATVTQPGQSATINPSDGSRVVVVATPGPPGPPGEIDPADMNQIADDATAQVLEDLEPPVTLSLLFENGLA